MPTFLERVQALPTELYDEIFDLTFTSDSVVIINKEYRPPATMQVNQATRAKWKNSYFDSDKIVYVDYSVIQKWVKSLYDAKVYIRSEIRVTGLLLQAGDLTRCQLSARAEHEVDRVFDLIDNNIANNYDSDCEYDEQTIDERDDFAGEIAHFLSFQIAFGEPEKRAWIPFRYLEETVEMYQLGDWGMSAAGWCGELFEKDAVSVNESVV